MTLAKCFVCGKGAMTTPLSDNNYLCCEACLASFLAVNGVVEESIDIAANLTLGETVIVRCLEGSQLVN